jgi:F-type H+-transporting ATPase subunit b
VLHGLLYQPLREAIDKRREANERAQLEADKARDEARTLQQELETRMAEFDRQRQESARQAHVQALAERQRLLDDAARTVQQKQEAGRTALAREREETLAALRGEIVDQAVQLSRRLLAEAANLSLDAQLADRLVEALREVPQSDRDELRRNWQPRDMAVLETAADLNGSPAIEQIATAAGDVLGQAISLNIQQREALVGGMRLRLGGRVWDASIAGQLEGLSHPAAQGVVDA